MLTFFFKDKRSESKTAVVAKTWIRKGRRYLFENLKIIKFLNEINGNFNNIRIKIKIINPSPRYLYFSVSLDTSELRRVNSKPVSTGGTLEGKTNSGYDAWLNRRKNLSDHGNSDSSSECGTDSTAICLSSRSDLSGLNDDNSLYHCPGREKLTENKTNQKMKQEYFSESVQQSNVQSSSQLSSHFCSVCSNLMVRFWNYLSV